MRRREFLGAIACIAWLPAVRAQQQAGGLHRIGILAVGGEHDALQRRRIAVLKAGLAEQGWIEGRNIAFETRYVAGQLDRVPALVAALLRTNVELIVTSGTQLIQGVQKASPTIPIVMAGIGDPVGAGVVESLARPGGNTTGLSLFSPELSGKRLELAKEALGRLTHVAIIWNPKNSSIRFRYKETAVAARKLGLALTSIQVRRATDIAPGLRQAVAAGAQALMTTEEALLFANRKHLADLAIGLRMPTISGLGLFAEAGALLSYGTNTLDLWHRAAIYVDKILKGAKPSDLPIEQPTRFELVINLRTAKALGVSVPPALLALADHVIE